MFSHKVQNLHPSVTITLNSRTKELAARGIKVYNFAVGEPPFPTPQPVIDICKQSLDLGKTKYGPAGGSLAFRQAIAKKLLEENQLAFEPTQIVAGMGAKELLFHIFLTLLNDGDEVILCPPYWVSYAEQIHLCGGIVKTTPTANDFATPISIAAIDKLATTRTKAIVINSPNNPSGYILPPQFLKELGAYLQSKNWWVISDEIYEYLSFDQPHFNLGQLCPALEERFILVNGMSKGFFMTGWRVGYCAGPKEVMTLVCSLQSHSSTCLPGFIDEAATYAIAQGKSLIDKEWHELKKLRDLAVTKINAAANIRFFNPEGAFYLFIDLREHLTKTRQNAITFAENLLNEHHIAVVPGDAFGSPGFIRLSYATSQADLITGIDLLLKVINRHA